MTVFAEERGQMVAEMAVMVPVILVCALVAMNGAWFANLCARFDRVAMDAALAHGVSPAGEQDATAAASQVKAAIEGAMADPDLVIEVSAEHLDLFSGGVFSISPSRVRFTCSMGYRPHPSSFSIAGASFALPVLATHTRSIVVDASTIGIGGEGHA